jgi:DNA-binding SARP family transcriptional activator
VRDATNTAICVLLRTLAGRQIADGHLVAAASSLRSILAIDKYDTAAHQVLIATLKSSGSHGLAAAAAEQFAAAMDDLGVAVPSGTGRR